MDTFRARWTTPDGVKLAHEVIRRLGKGKRIDRLGLGTHEGRVDLRGIVFPEPHLGREFMAVGYRMTLTSGMTQFHGARWEGLDLSHAHMTEVKFHYCGIADCRFDGADCQGFGAWDTTIESSSFVGSDLRRAGFGKGKKRRGNVWRGLDLSGTDLREAAIEAVTIERCDFSNAQLDGVHFLRCTLANCTFGGRLFETVFDGREWRPDIDGDPRPAPPEMRRMDFHRAEMELVVFKGYRLDDVTFPDEVRIIRRYQAVATRVLEILTGNFSQEAEVLAAVIENSLRGRFRDEDAAVFNRRDWLHLGGMGSQALADLASEVFAQAVIDTEQVHH
jgi:uncharacterized protein YjbI with pentapeptide repeats